MHVTLDQLNAVLEGTASSTEREAFTDHILECDACASKFKMFNQLRQEMTEADQVEETGGKVVRFPVRYALGAAAVMIMCLTPYLSKTVETSEPAPQAQVASANTDLNILKDVQKLNYKAAIDQWGEEVTLTDLVAMSNQLSH